MNVIRYFAISSYQRLVNSSMQQHVQPSIIYGAALIAGYKVTTLKWNLEHKIILIRAFHADPDLT